jgi:hypothetical protein
MSDSFFGSARGCVVKHTRGGGTGGYELEGFDFTDSPYPIILRNVQLTDNDIVLPVSTLNNKKILYAFGSDFGDLQIMGTVFLGPVGESTPGLRPVVDFFNNNAVSRSENPRALNLSMPGNVAYKIFLKTLTVQAADPDLNLHDFAFGAIIADTTSA